MPWPWTSTKNEIAPAGDGLKPEASSRQGLSETTALVMAFPDPVLLLNHQSLVVAANEQARLLLEADPVTHHISYAIRAPAVLSGVAQVLGEGKAVRVEYEVHGPIMRLFVAHISAVQPPSPQGIALMLVIKDLTRQQQIERMRSDFVANASHELRTPLASVSGFIETLLGAARHDEVAREKFLLLMRSQSERMKRLIDDLLSLSRIEMNAALKPSDPVDLAQVARHAVDSLAMVAQEAQVTIIQEVAPQKVLGDWDELVQVLLNLIENAIKYSGPGTVVRISGTPHAGLATVSVADQGPGIAAEHIPRLTERFYRINVQESRSRGGTGLGLAIVKHILNRHKGRLIIESEIGRGSRFTLQIPEISV